MKLTILGCVLIFLAVVSYGLILILPVTSPNPLVQGLIEGRAARWALIAGAVGAVIVVIGMIRQR